MDQKVSTSRMLVTCPRRFSNSEPTTINAEPAELAENLDTCSACSAVSALYVVSVVPGSLRTLHYGFGNGRGVASPSVSAAAHLIASKYICATSRLSHVS